MKLHEVIKHLEEDENPSNRKLRTLLLAVATHTVDLKNKHGHTDITVNKEPEPQEPPTPTDPNKVVFTFLVDKETDEAKFLGTLDRIGIGIAATSVGKIFGFVQRLTPDDVPFEFQPTLADAQKELTETWSS